MEGWKQEARLIETVLCSVLALAMLAIMAALAFPS